MSQATVDMPSTDALKVPLAPADLKTAWASLAESLDDIMARTDLRYAHHQSLYTRVYNYQKMASKLGGTQDITWQSDLYQNLILFFVSQLNPWREASESLRDEDLLHYYAKEWDRYTAGADYLNRVFKRLNRSWVKQQRDEGRRDVYPVNILALLQWKTNFFIHVQPNLTDALLRFRERPSNNKSVDQGLVKRVIDSFVVLGLDSANINRPCLDVYRERFERPFLDARAKYYKSKADSIFAGTSILDNLKEIEEHLLRELEEPYLHSDTRKSLLIKCVHLLWESVGDKDEALYYLYASLSRIPEGLDTLQKKFEHHVKKAGLSAISRLIGGDTESADAVVPKTYVDTLWDVREKNSTTVTRCFRGDTRFITSLDKACREFVNQNAATGTSPTKSSDLLARHADMLLRKNSKIVEGDLEGALNQVMTIFKYINDKDVFQTFYAAKLAKRLINGVSASDESEAGMISKLRDACGFAYTSKLQRMFADMSLSKDLTDSFKEHTMKQNHSNVDVNFTISILTSFCWPLTPPPSEFTIPAEILPMYNGFQKYYQTKHSGRKLTWLWNYSKNELQTRYLNHAYIFMTSSYQTAVLLQYNNNDTLSLDELVAATSIKKELLTQILALLVKAKILINEETEQYDLNPNFTSRKTRVNLNLPIKAEVKAETTDVLKTVDEGRKFEIQAKIVWIMKARKTMNNQALIQEVVSQISQRFVPQITDIKKAIDALLEKEYIERVEGLRDTFAYVA